MNTITFRRGGTVVEMSGTLERMVQRALEQADDAVLQAALKAVQKVHADAVAVWPVKTGESKEGLRVRTMIDEGRGEIRVSVVNDVSYAKYIRPRKLKGKSAFVTWLRKPLHAATKAIAADVAHAFAVSVKGG